MCFPFKFLTFICATFLLLSKWPAPCVMQLVRNQMVQNYRLHLVFWLNNVGQHGKLHFIFTPVDPNIGPIKSTLSLTLSRSLSLQRHLIAVRRNVLLVEAEGFAPSSCPSVDLYQRLHIYLYHKDVPMSTSFSKPFPVATMQPIPVSVGNSIRVQL